MTTWDNLFDGYDAVADAHAYNDHIYRDVVNNGSDLNTYIQVIDQAPKDISFIFTIFHASIVPITIVAVVIFVFFMPLFKRAQRW
jgi:hypothetical protein